VIKLLRQDKVSSELDRNGGWKKYFLKILKLFSALDYIRRELKKKKSYFSRYILSGLERSDITIEVVIQL